MLCKTVSSPYCRTAYAELAGCISRRRAVTTSNVLSSNGAKLCVQNAPTSQPEAQPSSLSPSLVHARTELSRCYSKRPFRKQTMHCGWTIGLSRDLMVLSLGRVPYHLNASSRKAKHIGSQRPTTVYQTRVRVNGSPSDAEKVCNDDLPGCAAPHDGR